MPLRPGNSKETVSSNISEFHTGPTYAHTAAKFGKQKANAQAIAVALNTARKYAEGGEVAPGTTWEPGGPEAMVTGLRRLPDIYRKAWEEENNPPAPEPSRQPLPPQERDETVLPQGVPFGVGSPAEMSTQTEGITPIAKVIRGMAEGQAKSAYEAAERYRQTGEYDAKPVTDAAMNVMGAPIVGAERGIASLGAGVFPKKALLKAAEAPNDSTLLEHNFLAGDLKKPYPKDIAQEVLDQKLGAKEAANVASYLSPGGQKAFWKWHQKLSDEVPNKENFNQVLDHIAGTNASDFSVMGQKGEVAAKAIQSMMEHNKPKFIAEQIHAKGMDGPQFDNVLSYIPKKKHHDILSHLVDLEEKDIKRFKAAEEPKYDPKYEQGLWNGDDYQAPQAEAPKQKFSNFGNPIHMQDMQEIPNTQGGSNPGGQYLDKSGKKFYIKDEPVPGHAQNEILGAKLYDLAGSKTLKYRPVEGGGKVATEWSPPEVNNANKFTRAQREKAQKDFAVHAWTANWDAVGLGGDNQAIIGGHPVTLDTGGSLEFRAKGGKKGEKFGNTVGEIDTLRDPNLNPDSAKFFAGMTEEQMKRSAKMVVGIPDKKIVATIADHGGSVDLADKLVARKNDLAKRFGIEKTDPDYINKHLPSEEWRPTPNELESMGFLDTSIGVQGTSLAKKVAAHLTPIKDWTKFRPYDYVSPNYRKTKGSLLDKHQVDKLPRMESKQGEIDFGPNDPKDLEKKGWGTHFQVWKRGNIYNKHPEHPGYPTTLMNPIKEKPSERGLFLGDRDAVVEGYEHYGPKGEPYILRPKKPMEIDFRNAFGTHNYHDGPYMHEAIEQAIKQGADLLLVNRVKDNHRTKKAEIHTQYVVLDTSIMRSPKAKFDPTKAHTRDPLSAVAGTLGTGAAAYGLSQGDKPEGMKRGGAVLDRALRLAKKYASGGALDETGLGMVKNHIPHPAGMLNSSIPGRTDKLPINVKAGSYVMPADTVSALGEGNTLGGTKMLDHMVATHMAKRTPHMMGSIKPPGVKRLKPAPLRARAADGGLIGEPDDNKDIPIVAAGGEYVVHPRAVRAIGGGDLEAGHDMLDKFVLKTRRDLRRKLGKLKPPKVD